MKFLFGEIPYLFRFFQSMIGYRMYAVIIFIVAATATEIVGVSLFLPVLNGGEGTDVISRGISASFEYFGIPLSFTAVLIVMIGVMMLRTIILIFRDVLVALSSAQIGIDLNKQLLNALGKAEYKSFIELNVGRVNNTVSVEIPRVFAAFEMTAATAGGVFFAFAYIALGVMISPFLALVMIVAAPFGYLAISWSNRRIRRLSFMTTDAAGLHQHWMLHVLHNFKYLRTTGTWDVLNLRVVLVATTLAYIRRRVKLFHAGSTGFLGMFAFLIVTVVLLQQVNFGGADVLEAAFMLFLLKRGFDQVLAVQSSYRKLLNVVGGVHNFTDLVMTLRVNSENDHEGTELPNFAADLELHDVSVSYRGRGKVLSNLSLEMKAGERVALVGASGAGKSTALAVLTGLISPDSGSVSINGVGLDDIDLAEFRKRIGYVPQDPAVFDDSLYNNLTLWNDQIDPSAVEDALEAVQFTNTLNRLPNGLETVIGPNGTALSGGERQRISIARELLRGPELLVLDEATSAIDGPTEKRIYEVLRQKFGSITTIIVAHRFETIRDCDCVYVLSNGGLVESGTYDQLLNAGGEFTRLLKNEFTNGPGSAV
jgi:ABC-type multidrug transport system fused ATPase/permease subunit